MDLILFIPWSSSIDILKCFSQHRTSRNNEHYTYAYYKKFKDKHKKKIYININFQNAHFYSFLYVSSYYILYCLQQTLFSKKRTVIYWPSTEPSIKRRTCVNKRKNSGSWWMLENDITRCPGGSSQLDTGCWSENQL